MVAIAPTHGLVDNRHLPTAGGGLSSQVLTNRLRRIGTPSRCSLAKPS
jgi:hypothetical protein